MSAPFSTDGVAHAARTGSATTETSAAVLLNATVAQEKLTVPVACRLPASGALDGRDLVVRHLRNKALVYENVPAGRPVQSADQVKQGALPGAARSHDDGKLPFRYVERDPGQRRDFVLPLAIHFANVDAADHEARCFNR